MYPATFLPFKRFLSTQTECKPFCARLPFMWKNGRHLKAWPMMSQLKDEDLQTTYLISVYF